ncbi:Plant peroxidase [Corchorus capsularis]|uniref:peroxidase n=1 Tax=Corchorus capsularis TaxID=210143 RepID=A0A1R3JJ96_COCAP|nr:Plant peroxidase [Corchorus capsularis]
MATPFSAHVLSRKKSLNLAGDAFDLIVRAKTALELQCAGDVSYSDILAESARNLVVMAAGPFYTVKLGRKDSKVSIPPLSKPIFQKSQTQ